MATDQQPKALRLADLCRSGALINNEWDEVAAELLRLHAVESGAKVELMRRANLIDSLHGLCESYRTQVESLQVEVNEQARLNGMGAERELALMAKVEILQAASVEWSPAYTRGPARQSAPVAAVPAMVQLTEEQMISAVRPLCNTDQVAERLVAVSIDEYRAIEAASAKLNGLTVGDGAHSGALHCKKCHADRAKEGCRNQYRDCPFTGNAQPIKDAP